MHKRSLGLLLGLFVLATAPGCRVLATAGVIAGTLAADWAVSSFEEQPHCDDHSLNPPTERCR